MQWKIQINSYQKILDNDLSLKKSIGPTTQYLGDKVPQVTLDNGTICWSISLSQYIQAAVKNVEDHLAKKGDKLHSRAKSLWSTGYISETDISPELSSSDATYFQLLVGVLKWIGELNRLYIRMEISALVSMIAMPREEYLS